MGYDPVELKDSLDGLYVRLNRREMVHPDPLEFLYRYTDAADREVAAIVASGLAYGRVCSILGGVGTVLGHLGPHPAKAIAELTSDHLRDRFGGFRYRFTTGDEIASVLGAVAVVRAERGSLGNLFSSLLSGATFHRACDAFVRIILDRAGLRSSSLLPLPSRGSACKRLNLMLRWMVRRDDVDPGGWEGVDPSVLRVPLDVHMYRAGLLLEFTSRKAADWKTVEEITEGFRRIRPDDPARYDFSLTRFGIRADMDPAELFTQIGLCAADTACGG